MEFLVALITLNRDRNKCILAGSALCEPHPLKIEKKKIDAFKNSNHAIEL